MNFDNWVSVYGLYDIIRKVNKLHGDTVKLFTRYSKISKTI